MEGKLIYDLSQAKFSKFKNTIKESINEVSNLKIIEYENEIKDLIGFENENDLFYEFLFLINFPKWINLNTDYAFQENKYIINDIYENRKNNEKNLSNKNTYRIIVHMEIFFLSKIETIIASLIQQSDKIDSMKSEIEEINQAYQILVQILFFLLKLYEQKIYNLNKILLFFDILIIFISKNVIVNDKCLKIKNIIFLGLLAEKYFGYFLNLLMDNQEDNKADIVIFFKYIFKILNLKII